MGLEALSGQGQAAYRADIAARRHQEAMQGIFGQLGGAASGAMQSPGQALICSGNTFINNGGADRTSEVWASAGTVTHEKTFIEELQQETDEWLEM